MFSWEFIRSHLYRRDSTRPPLLFISYQLILRQKLNTRMFKMIYSQLSLMNGKLRPIGQCIITIEYNISITHRYTETGNAIFISPYGKSCVLYWKMDSIYTKIIKKNCPHSWITLSVKLLPPWDPRVVSVIFTYSYSDYLDQRTFWTSLNVTLVKKIRIWIWISVANNPGVPWGQTNHGSQSIVLSHCFGLDKKAKTNLPATISN